MNHFKLICISNFNNLIIDGETTSVLRIKISTEDQGGGTFTWFIRKLWSWQHNDLNSSDSESYHHLLSTSDEGIYGLSFRKFIWKWIQIVVD